VTTTWHSNALQRWGHQSLANAFVLRAAVIAIGSSLVVAFISLAVIFWVEEASLHAQLQDKARRVAEQVERSIGVVESAVADLAGSSLFMAALLDSPGRNAYVVPFLENYRFPIAVASGLALCDLKESGAKRGLDPLKLPSTLLPDRPPYQGTTSQRCHASLHSTPAPGSAATDARHAVSIAFAAS
jgi:hypothetical protein